MFNLGFKQIVINGDAQVTEVGTTSGVSGVITIAGFGEFTIPEIAAAAARGGKVTASAAAALGVYTAVIAGFDAAKTYDIKLKVKNARDVSGIYTGHSGDTWTFQTGAGAGFGTAAAAGQIAGFNDDLVVFSGTTDLVVTFQAGLEGATLESMEVIETSTETVMPITSITIDTVPSYGVGLGKIIEEEVQNATMANLDPYGLGGMDTVDIRGTYTEIMWEAVAEDDDSPGWEPHAMLGEADVNTTQTYGPRQFIAYVNEASAAATVTLLTKLVDGEAQAV